MALSVVEVPVDEESAKRYQTLSSEDRERFQEVISLLLRDASQLQGQSTLDIAREGGRVAAANGMTQEVLDELLRD